MALNKWVLTVLVLSILIISGCSGGSKDVTLSNPYMGGSQGIVANFEPMGVSSSGASQSIFSDEDFPVQIAVKNKGEFSLPTGAVRTTLKGISPRDYQGLSFSMQNNQLIEKISETNLKGGETTIDHNKGKLNPNVMGNINVITANLFADVVYPYESYVTVPKVCYKDVTSKTSQDEICQVDAALTLFSSGAPIRATSAKEQRSGKGLVSVEFTVENVGGGEAKVDNTKEFDIRYDEIGFAVSATTSNKADWECRSGGSTTTGRFGDDKKLIIICKLKTPIPSDQVYQSNLDLTLSYVYKSIISTDLVIKNKNI